MTNILPGQLLYIFGSSIFDAALLSWLALLWYRRSVNRLMRAATPDPAAAPVERQDTVAHSPSAVSSPEPGELKLIEEPPDSASRAAAATGPAKIRTISAYSAGAAAFAAVITCLKFWSASPPMLAVAWLAEWWTNLWP